MRRPNHWLLILVLVFLAACGESVDAPVTDAPSDEPASDLRLVVQTDAPLTEVDARFLSFTVDTSKAVPGPGGQRYDFSRPRLRRMTEPLAPAYLRVGGTRADEVYVDLSDAPLAEPPAGYGRVMTQAIWDGICGFANDLGLDLLFTLNAGPGPRDLDEAWTPDNARALLEDVVRSGCPVAVWELGNEINGFVGAFGLDAVIDGERYAADMAVARGLVDEVTPEVALAGPASAFWPLWGEFSPVLPEFLALGREWVDLVTWHYYPQQSASCPIASRPAELETLLEPAALDEIDVWAQHVEAHAAGLTVWLGETSHAQCGGEPGLSDRYVTGLWWLDQLGAMARRGQPVVMRQALSGGHYSLIDDATLAPRPDYFTSVLWKRLMGPRVLDVAVEPSGAGSGSVDPSMLRVYAHCTPDRGGAVTLALVHLGADQVRLDVPEALGDAREVYLLTAPQLTSPTLALNGVELEVTEAGDLPSLPPVLAEGVLVWPGRSYGYLVLPDASAPACE